MNRLYVLVLLIGLCIFVSSCSEYLPDNLIESSLEESDTGIVWVRYDKIIPKDDLIPADVVNEFLIQEGYATSKVMDVWYQQNGYSIQKIYLGEGVDPSPLLDGLRNLRGVLSAELDMDVENLSGLPPEGILDEVLLDY